MRPSKQKIALIINTSKGLYVLESLKKSLDNRISAVISYNDPNTQDDSFSLIEEYCIDNNLNFLHSKSPKQINNHLLALKVDLNIVVGWQYLLLDETINKIQTLIFHDSILPKYRGFCPTATALIKGDKELGVSVLQASSKVDEGPILFQKKVKISYPIKLQEANERILALFMELTDDIVQTIKKDEFIFSKQDESQATFSIWRSVEDMKINWNQTSEEILRFINALGYPLSGATTQDVSETYTIISAEKETDINFEIRQPGKIWCVENGIPTIVCKSGLLKLTKILNSNGENISWKKLKVRFE